MHVLSRRDARLVSYASSLEATDCPLDVAIVVRVFVGVSVVLEKHQGLGVRLVGPPDRMKTFMHLRLVACAFSKERPRAASEFKRYRMLVTPAP